MEIKASGHLDLSDYLIATLGRDGWRKGIEALSAETACLAAAAFLLVPWIIAALSQDLSDYRNVLLMPSFEVIFFSAFFLFLFIFCFPMTFSMFAPMLHIRVGDTKIGQGFIRRMAERCRSAGEAEGVGLTRGFYYGIRKEFETAAFDDDGVVVGGRDRISYSDVYKIFMPAHRRFLVLRCTWQGGPRDVIINLDNLGDRETDRLIRFLEAHLPEETMCYGKFGAERRKNYFQVRDPWDAWFHMKVIGATQYHPGTLVRKKRWEDWHLPYDAPVWTKNRDY